MLAPNIAVITKPCSSCAVYGGGQCQFSCQPGRRITQGHFRGATRSAFLSALILENARIQEQVVRQLVRTSIQLPIAELLIPKYRRYGLRSLCRLFGDQLVNAFIPRILHPRVVPLGQ